MDRDDLVAIERAVVRGWPALQSERIGGWLARWSSGGSVRANSVATVDFDHSLQLDEAIGQVSEFYRRHGATPKFTISGTSNPDDLDSHLAARGWRRSGSHVTMSKPVEPAAMEKSQTGVVEQQSHPSEEWLNVYLLGLSEDRRGVATQLVHGVPHPRHYFGVRRDGKIIGSGLSVVDGKLASVQCMATLASARRTGAATAVLTAIENNARASGVGHLYLQTDADNIGAIKLYERYGFVLVDRYHTRSQTN